MNSFVAVVAGLVVTGLVAGSADAAVLCVKKKGQIVQRASVCKSQKQEVALNLAQVPGATGAQGPTGPAGPQGPAGPAGSNVYSIFSTLPIDLSTLTGLTSVAHLDLPAGNYLVMGKMVVNSLLPTLADCNLQSGSSILDVAGLGSLLGLRPASLFGVLNLGSAGGVDIVCPQVAATLDGLQLIVLNLESLTSVPLP